MKVDKYRKSLNEILDAREYQHKDSIAMRLANLMTIIEQENGGINQVIERQNEITDVYLEVRKERDVYLFSP